MAFSAREAIEEGSEMSVTVATDVVRTHDLHRSDRSLETGFVVDQQGDPDGVHCITNVVRCFVIVIAEDCGAAIRDRLEWP